MKKGGTRVTIKGNEEICIKLSIQKCAGGEGRKLIEEKDKE